MSWLRDVWNRLRGEVTATSLTLLDGHGTAGVGEAVPEGLEWHEVVASSFADPKDVEAFNRCRAQGKTEQECFKVGDNGIGCWGDNTAQGQIAMCALPPDDMIEEWGTVDRAKRKLVRVTIPATGRSALCVLADRMPWKRNIKNGAGIDLNPAAVRELGMKPPIKVKARWAWEQS